MFSCFHRFAQGVSLVLVALLLLNGADARADDTSMQVRQLQKVLELRGLNIKAQVQSMSELNQWIMDISDKPDTKEFAGMVDSNLVPELVGQLRNFQGEALDTAVLLIVNIERVLEGGKSGLDEFVKFELLSNMGRPGVSPMRRSGVLRLLRDSSGLSAAEVAEVRSLLEEEKSPMVLLRANQLLAANYHASQAARELYLESLSSENVDQRMASVDSLIDVSFLDADLLGMIQERLGDSSRAVCQHTIIAVRMLASKDADPLIELLPHLQDIALNANAEMRITAIQAIGYIAHYANSAKCLDVLSNIVNDNSFPVDLRAMVLEDFPFYSNCDAKFYPLYRTYKNNEDARLAEAAHKAMSRCQVHQEE